MENENKQEVLLRVEHLSQHFGKVKAVDDVSFDIMKGDCLLYTSPSPRD